MTKVIFSTLILITSFSIFCHGQDIAENKTLNPPNNKTINTMNTMNSYISIFEIPATDISRAINFYQTILDIKLEAFDMPDMQLAVFPTEGQAVVGVIIKEKDSIPAANGVTIYLYGGDNLKTILDKVENNGGTTIVPKTLHADESGYFALFIDSEGNKIGLHSPN